MIIKFLLLLVVVLLIYGLEFLYNPRKAINWIFHLMECCPLWSMERKKQSRLYMGSRMGNWGWLMLRNRKLWKCLPIKPLFEIFYSLIAITSWRLARTGSSNYGPCLLPKKWKRKNNLLRKDFVYLVTLVEYIQYVNLGQACLLRGLMEQ